MALDPLDVIADICHDQPHDALTQIAAVLGFTEDTAQREQTLAGLLKRCARCLPPNHATRKLATDYLRQHGYLSPLRRPDGVRACRKCGGAMKPGKAMQQTVDCGDEGTCSPAGPGVLIDCMKCERCGWSVTPGVTLPDGSHP